MKTVFRKQSPNIEKTKKDLTFLSEYFLRVLYMSKVTIPPPMKVNRNKNVASWISMDPLANSSPNAESPTKSI